MREPRRPRARLLHGGDVETIVDQAIDAVGSIGVRVEGEQARALLDGGGHRVEGERVYLTSDGVGAALSSAPARVEVFDRDGEPALDLGADRVHFDPGSAALFVLDPAAGRRRATVDDCVRLARVTERCRHMAAQSTGLVPADVPEPLADRYRLYLALQHGTKPVITGTFRVDGFAVMRDLLAIVRGSEQALRDRPLAIFDCCPTPPLTWSELTVQALIDAARAGVPAELVSMPLGGATAPVSLREMVVQHTAECLSGVVIHQLAAPGAPIVWGGSPAAFDMRHGTTPMGAIETMMVEMAYAQVGRQLGLPTHAYMALSDAKGIDWQAGAESGIGAVLAALAGVNMVSGAGLLDFENCLSLEKLVLDDEACGMALRLTRGIGSASADEAVELLQATVASGQMLGHPHTRRRFREELYLPGPVIDRRTHGDWEAAGAHDAAAAAALRVSELLAADGAPPLDADVRRALDERVAADARSLGVAVPQGGRG